MDNEKNKFNKQVNDIISNLEKLDTEEILESENDIVDFNDIVDDLDSDPLSILGSKIDHWTVLELLGHGGMSIVYLVERNDEQIQKKAALKIIPNTKASKNMIDRFLRERQILSDLNHNNIARLYDAGISENDIPWFVMELIQGENILNYAESRHLDTDQRISLFKQVCDALTYAHDRGIVHRDIKPNNLMVNDQGVIKLLDFGIASDDEKKSLTMTGAIIGTPGYMSPEQAKGLNQQMDKRTDIFSLGVLFYKLLTKEMPFQAESSSEISYKIIHNEPILMGKKVSKDLQAIIFKCLEKSKEKRYQTVIQLSNDIDLYRNGDEVTARKITFIGRLRKKVIKNPLTSFILSVVLLITLFSIIYGTYQSFTSLKKVQLAEIYTAKSQEIKANVWRTHMLPVHDPNEEYQQYNQQIEELKNQIESDNAAESGQANYALGKAYNSMSNQSKAHENFIIARDKGWSSIELMSDLGESFSYKWQTAIIEAKVIKNETEKKLFLDSAKKEYYTPAMYYLNLASKGIEKPYKLLAFMAFNEKKYLQAIEFINKEIAHNPWNFTVLNMASQIHLLNFHKQSTEQGYDTALIELVKSNEYLEKAIDIGRSYPRNYTSRCSNAGIEVQLKRFFGFGREMDDIFESGMKYCQQALIMKPKAYSPWANMSYLYTNYARYLEKDSSSNNNDKIMEIYIQSIENAEKGLLLHINNEKMINSKVQPNLSLAKYNHDNFLLATRYYSEAIEAAVISSELSDNSVSSTISQGLAHAAYANYLRDSKTDNMYSTSAENYESAIKAFQLANKKGKDFMSQINLAGAYYEYSVLKSKLNNIDESIKLLYQAFIVRNQHTPIRASMFIHIKNQFKTITDLMKALDNQNNQFNEVSQKTTVFIQKICLIDGLVEEDKNTVNEFINQAIKNNWIQQNTIKNCQLK